MTRGDLGGLCGFLIANWVPFVAPAFGVARALAGCVGAPQAAAAPGEEIHLGGFIAVRSNAEISLNAALAAGSF